MLKKIREYALSIFTVVFFAMFLISGGILNNHAIAIISGLATIGCGYFALQYELK